jgi:hypothetical protein
VDVTSNIGVTTSRSASTYTDFIKALKVACIGGTSMSNEAFFQDPFESVLGHSNARLLGESSVSMERVWPRSTAGIALGYSMASHTASTVAAIASLKTAVPSAQVGFIAFDLTILSAARAAAEEFWERKERIGFERGGGECFLTPQVIYSG